MTEKKLDSAEMPLIKQARRLIDDMPAGPERDCEQGKLNRLLAKLDAMPGRIADQLAGVSDRNKIREVVCREFENVVSELPGGKSTGN